jgi:hypothetical protein
MKNQNLATVVGMCMLLMWPTVSSQEPSGPREYPSTGNAFDRLCSVVEKNKTETQHGVACIAYVVGLIDGVSKETEFVLAVSNKQPPMPFCLSDDVENGQLIRIVLRYIRNHPEEAHLSTAFLVVQALREAFPCQANR